MTQAEITRTGGREATTGHIAGDCVLAVGMPDAEPRPGWRWRLLTELARLETGHTPSRRHPEYWDGDIPWIGIRDATANHGLTLGDTGQHVTQEGIDNSSARVLPANTVCLSRTASVGYVVVMGKPMATSQDFVNWVCNPEVLDYRYLKYALLAERTSYSRFAHGTTHQTIYFPEVKAFHLCAPSIASQSVIASVLGALDDKIEQNRRMARALDRLARAIFRAWFVDFEPVKAKAAGATAFPSMPQPVFDALPTRFFDSPLGPVPEGWEVGAVEDLCAQITSGGTPGRRNRRFWDDGTIDWFKTGELQDGPLLKSAEQITQEGLENSSCKLWPAGTVLFALYASPTVGRLGVLTREATSNQAAAGLIAKPEVGVPYLMHALLESRAELQRIAVGAAQQNINQGVLKSHRVICPPVLFMGAYSNAMDQTLALRVALAREGAQLAAMRDYLLPKLLSGTVRVRDIGQMAEEVMS